MKEIKLTQSKVVIVDDEDFKSLNQFKWCAYYNNTRWEARRSSNRIKGKQQVILMHRLIINTPEELVVDHINGDGLDNRKENLRNCTQRQNSQNRKKCYDNNTLGIKGVSLKKNKFLAYIKTEVRSIYLGSFSVLGDADSAYRLAEEKYFRDFAR